MAKKKKRGLRKASYAHIARPLVYTTLDYVTTSSQRDEKMFDPAKAAKHLLKKNNFKKIQKLFNGFVKKYNKSEDNTLSDKYHAINFLAAFTDKKSDLKILKNAQYQFLVYCFKEIAQQPHNQEGKGLVDIFAKSIACALSIDDQQIPQKTYGSFEREMAEFIKTISKMVTNLEKEADGLLTQNNFIAQINQAEIQAPSLKPKTLVRFVAGILYNAYLSMVSFFSMGWNRDTKVVSSALKKSKFDQKDFIENHREHLPDIVFFMNHVFHQNNPDDKEAQEFLYGLFKMSFLKKNISLRNKVFGKWSDALLKHLKREELLPITSIEEKEDIKRRNNAREHLLDIALHNLFPEMESSDYYVFKKDFQAVIQKMGDKLDLAKMTPEMIEILRKPENQSKFLPLIDAGVSKVLRYNPAQLTQDAARNSKMSNQAMVLPQAESHFVSEFVCYLLQSPMTSSDIAQVLKNIPNHSKDPASMIISLLVVKKNQYPEDYCYNNDLINHMILTKPATFLRFITKMTLEGLRKNRSHEEQLMSHFCKAFDGHIEKLALLVTGIADLAVARDTKNPNLTKKGVEKILQTLPLLNESLFQASPPNQLVKSLAALLLKKPHNPQKRKADEIEDIQVAFLKNLVADISNSTAQDQNIWAQSLADLIGFADKNTILFKKIWAITHSHNMTTSVQSFNGLHRAYSALSEEQKQIMSECYPKIYNLFIGLSYTMPVIDMTLKVFQQSYIVAASIFGFTASTMNSIIQSFQEPRFNHTKPPAAQKTKMPEPQNTSEFVQQHEEKSKQQTDVSLETQPVHKKERRSCSVK